MKRAALRIGLAVGFAILTAAVSAQAQNSLNIRAQRAVSCNDPGVAMLNAGKVGRCHPTLQGSNQPASRLHHRLRRR